MADVIEEPRAPFLLSGGDPGWKPRPPVYFAEDNRGRLIESFGKKKPAAG